MRATCKKGLSDIPTFSGRMGQNNNPSRTYMQITCLEMEKIRLNKEQECAQRRINIITGRLAQIEQEKAALLCSLQEQRADRSIVSVRTKKASGELRGGFKLKY